MRHKTVNFECDWRAWSPHQVGSGRGSEFLASVAGWWKNIHAKVEVHSCYGSRDINILIWKFGNSTKWSLFSDPISHITGFCIILATGRQSHFQIWKSMFKGTTNHNFYSTAPSHRNGRLGYIHSLHSNTDKVSSLLQVFCKILYMQNLASSIGFLIRLVYTLPRVYRIAGNFGKH